jgi:hypothetical protein
MEAKKIESDGEALKNYYNGICIEIRSQSYDFGITYNASAVPMYVIGKSVFIGQRQYLGSQFSLGYLWRCKFLQRRRCNSRIGFRLLSKNYLMLKPIQKLYNTKEVNAIYLHRHLLLRMEIG